MTLVSNRHLVVSEDTLGKADLKFILKHTCSFNGCGKGFSIKITKQKYDQKAADKRRYKVRCADCRKQTTFSQSQADRFERLFGIQAKIMDNNFDDLFSGDE